MSIGKVRSKIDIYLGAASCCYQINDLTVVRNCPLYNKPLSPRFYTHSQGGLFEGTQQHVKQNKRKTKENKQAFLKVYDQLKKENILGHIGTTLQNVYQLIPIKITAT